MSFCECFRKRLEVRVCRRAKAAVPRGFLDRRACLERDDFCLGKPDSKSRYQLFVGVFASDEIDKEFFSLLGLTKEIFFVRIPCSLNRKNSSGSHCSSSRVCIPEYALLRIVCRNIVAYFKILCNNLLISQEVYNTRVYFLNTENMVPHNICVPGKVPMTQKDVIVLMNSLRDMSFETASVFIEMNNKILEAMFLFSPSLI